MGRIVGLVEEPKKNVQKVEDKVEEKVVDNEEKKTKKTKIEK